MLHSQPQGVFLGRDHAPSLGQMAEESARRYAEIMVSITLLLLRIPVSHVLECSGIEHSSVRSRTNVVLRETSK